MITPTEHEAGSSDSGVCGCICGVLLTLVLIFIVLPIAFGVLMAFLGV